MKMKHDKINGIYGTDTIHAIAPKFAAIILWMFAILLAPITARAQASVNVSNFTELQDAVTSYSAATGDMTITVTADFSITANLEIPANAGGYSITISGDIATRTLTRGVYGFYDNPFYVGDGAKLILENIIIDGNKDSAAYQNNPSALVFVWNGVFNMAEGAVLKNNGGGGVSVYSGGLFTMSGGEITGNIDSNYGGGGVYGSGSTFTMTGGKISGNTASTCGGVSWWTGTFTMTGGEISGNTASNYGGLCTSSNPSNTQTLGGTAVITGNTPDNVYFFEGDAPYILSTDTPPAPGMNIGVHMQPDSVIAYTAREEDADYFHADADGLKVVYDDGKLIIIDTIPARIDFYRQIKNYSSAVNNITIEVDQDLKLINDEYISNDYGATLTIRSADAANPVTLTRSDSWSLFTVSSGARLILENIIIDGNRVDYPNNTYALVWVDNGGEFKMEEGAVLKNNGGGGVYVRGSTFTMTDGEIRGNTADLGGGVYVDYGTFTMTGGKISGNTADLGGGVYSNWSPLTFGGTAVVTGNTPNNVYLEGYAYIELSTDIPPAPGMNIGVHAPLDSVIANGAREEDANYFHADETDKGVIFEDGQLIITAFVPVTYITDLPTTSVAGTMLALTGTVIPENAANRTIVWSVVDAGDTGAEITGNMLNTISDGTVVIRAVIINGTASGTTYTQDFSIDVTPPVGWGTWGISLNPSDDKTFDAAIYGYGTQTTHSVTVNNTGNQPTGDLTVTLSGANANSFILSTAVIYSIEVDGNDIFTVAPRTGLNAGTYTATVTVGGGINITPQSFTVNFNVKANVYANSFPELQAEINDYANATSDVVITVTADIPITTNLTLPANVNDKTLTIRSADAENPVTMTRGFRGVLLFTVNGGAKLILENIIIDGNFEDSPNFLGNMLVYVNGGEFTMEDGAVLKNNRTSNGGGVYVNTSGTFTMNGGEISGNTVATYNGGGVYVNTGGTFTMNGGEISGNTAGTFGGGVYVIGTFTMNGGEISGNTAGNDGGGVSGTFTMSGGEISGNTAGNDGGGVSGIFTMSGGKISGNTASYGGGGVSPSSGSTMSGGEISGNTAPNGGGVYVSGGIFTMTGGEIIENTADLGGGVYFSSGTFTMTGGEISSNAVTTNGGGVYFKTLTATSSSTLTLGGTAIIIQNTRNGEGNNVYLTTYRYITLSTDIPPAPGMNVSVQVEAASGIIVNSGASEVDAVYFHADLSSIGMMVIHEGDRLLINYGSLSNDVINDIYASATNDVTYTIDDNLAQRSPIIIPANVNGKTLTIRSADAANPVTLTRIGDGNLFTVNSGAKLVFENIIIAGNYASSRSPLVYVNGGEFTMEDGAVLKNNNAYNGGVYVDSGAFTMNGGEISGNVATSYGGGVYVNTGTFTMNGGEISGNTARGDGAGGVYVRGGTFTMTGGKIIGNAVSPTYLAASAYGGGVFVHYGTFTMTGGEISGNTVSSIYSGDSPVYGGGVYVSSNDTFTLGGTAVIVQNTANAQYIGSVYNNVYLPNGRYITLSTDIPPAPGMDISVTTATESGVIVNSGAREGDEAYFFVDEYGKGVIFQNNQLVIEYVHSILITDSKTLDPIENVTVIINGKVYTTDGRGRIETLESGSYCVLISATGYRTNIQCYELISRSYQAVFMEESANDGLTYITLVNDINEKIDLRYQTRSFVEEDKTQLNLYVAGEWGTYTDTLRMGFRLYQESATGVKGKVITKYLNVLNYNGISNLASFSFAPGTTLQPGLPVKLEMIYYAGGTVTELPWYLFGGTTRTGGTETTVSTPIEINLDINKRNSTPEQIYDIGQNISIGGNANPDTSGMALARLFPALSFQGALLPVEISEETSSNGYTTMKGVVGIFSGEYTKKLLGGDSKDNGSQWENFKKDILEAKEDSKTRKGKLDKILKDAKPPRKPEFKGTLKLEMNVAGFFEIVFDDKGIIVAESTSGGIIFEGAAGVTYTAQFMAGPVPVYFELGVSAEVNAGIQLDFYKSQDDIKTRLGGSLSLVIPKLLVGGGVGIKGLASVGLEGSAQLNVGILPEWTGSVGAYGAVRVRLLFIINFSWKFAQGEWQLWPNQSSGSDPGGGFGGGGGGNRSIASTMALFGDIPDGLVPELSLASRDYTSRTSAWLGGGGVSISSALRSASVEYDSINTLQEWIMPDTIPQIAKVGDDLVMLFQYDDPARALGNHTVLMYSIYGNGGWSNPQPVWQSNTADMFYKHIVVNDELYVVWQKQKAQVTQTDADALLQEVSKNSEIAFARFNKSTGMFENQVFVTNNNFLDMYPTIAVNGSEISVVWASNSESDALGDSGIYSIMRSVYNGTSFSAPVNLYETMEFVSELAAGYVNNQLEIAFTAGDSADNTAAYILDTTGASRFTGDNPAIALKFNDGRFYWHSLGSVYSYNPLTRVSARVEIPDTNAVTSSYKLVNTDNKEAIVWTSDDGESYSIKTSLRLDNGRWTLPVTLLTRDEVIQYMDVAVSAGGAWNIVMNTAERNTEAEEEDTMSSLVFAVVTSETNTELTYASADQRDAVDGFQPVNFSVKNLGDTVVRSINVDISSADETYLSETLACEIEPGEEKDFTVDIDVSDMNRVTDLTVFAASADELNVSNNSWDIQLGQVDVSIGLTMYTVGDNVVVTAKISNMSATPADVKISVMEDSLDGNVLEEKELGVVTGDYIHTFRVGKNELDYDEEGRKILYFKIDTLEPNYREYDNSKIVIIYKKVEYELTGEAMEEIDLVPVESVSVAQSSIYLNLDDDESNTAQLSATVSPANATNTGVRWVVEDSNIVKVDIFDVVHALTPGETIITAVTNDGEYTDTVKVVVIDTQAAKYQLTIKAGSGGSVLTGASGQYETGDTVEISAVANTGYIFKQWSSSGGGEFDNAYSANAVFTMPANSATVTAEFASLTFGISISPAGGKNFGEAALGYGAQTAHNLTIINTGTQPTGALTIALSGANASSFTLSTNTIGSIAVGGKGSFTVAPKTGLGVGTYTATVTVSGDANIATRSFAVSFTVTDAPDYGILLSPSGDKYFGTALVGYGAQAAHSVTVLNTGTQPTGALTIALSGANAGSFTPSTTTINNIAAGYSSSFTIAPKTGLAAGTYTATVTVSGANITARSFNVSFTVATAFVPEDTMLSGIPGLSFEMDGDAPVFVDADDFDIKDYGKGNFSVVLYGDTDDLTIYGVEYVIENVPVGATPALVIEKDGIETPLDIFETGEPGLYVGSEMTFNHGDKGVFKIYVNGKRVGTFTVIYVNEADLMELPAQQSYLAGNYYFAPIDLLGDGYTYEIIVRPDTIGGTAPLINNYGQFDFAEQRLHLSVSRAGEYLVRAAYGNGDVVAVFLITVE